MRVERSGDARATSLALRYSIVGAFVGVGAPAGAMLLRVLGGAEVAGEFRDHGFFYAYQLLGTCLVFAALGFVAGRRADRFRSGRDQYRKLAERDFLTNLVNVRTFQASYERAVAHAARFGEPLALLLIDVDQLKGLNDQLGHSFGSAALRHVAAVIERTKRATDLAARWGGDEFAVLMPGAGPEAARRQADAILETLFAEPVRVNGHERQISTTIGVATSTSGSGRDLFEVADRALYAGKRAGRGQIYNLEA